MQVNLKLELFKLFVFELSMVSSKPSAKIKKLGDKVEKSANNAPPAKPK